MSLQVRQATPADDDAVAAVVAAAFGEAEGAELTTLVADLVADPAAAALSLVATDGERVVGHVLFTATRLEPAQEGDRSAILAPLAVDPARQGQGVGGRLVEAGLARLRDAGVRLVFVLGHPGYYPRFGFAPAGERGLDAPYPIAPENAPAWMVTELEPGAVERYTGVVRCAAALDEQRHWVE